MGGKTQETIPYLVERVRVLEEVLVTVIAWNVREDGEEGAKQLLEKLRGDQS